MQKIETAFCLLVGKPPPLDRTDSKWWLPSAYEEYFEKNPSQGPFCLVDPLAYITIVFNDLFYWVPFPPKMQDRFSCFETDQKFVSREMLCVILSNLEQIRLEGEFNMLTDFHSVISCTYEQAKEEGKNLKWCRNALRSVIQDLLLVHIIFGSIGGSCAKDTLERLKNQASPKSFEFD